MNKLPHLVHEKDPGHYYDRKPTLPQTGNGSIVRMPEKVGASTYAVQGTHTKPKK